MSNSTDIYTVMVRYKGNREENNGRNVSAKMSFTSLDQAVDVAKAQYFLMVKHKKLSEEKKDAAIENWNHKYSDEVWIETTTLDPMYELVPILLDFRTATKKDWTALKAAEDNNESNWPTE